MDNKKSNGSGMAVGAIIVLMLIMLGACGGDTESDYEKDLHSGWDKWSSGDYGSMSDDERDAVNDFLEWSNDN